MQLFFVAINAVVVVAAVGVEYAATVAVKYADVV